MKALLDLNFILPCAVACFWAIVFLQSGIDKVFDFKGNVDWLKGHFEKSFLGKFTSPLVATLTVFELVAGGLSAYGLINFLMTESTQWIEIGLIFSMISLLMLIFGQRIAKDYDGAKTIAIYFGVALLSALVLG
ncbi:MAG: DoxX family protein [Saprospiraceae bacterium]|nr:DoxX family protein [Saprospiraceae bacterium]